MRKRYEARLRRQRRVMTKLRRENAKLKRLLRKSTTIHLGKAKKITLAPGVRHFAVTRYRPSGLETR